MISKTESGITTTYSYDYANRLTEVRSQMTDVRYKYDGYERRIFREAKPIGLFVIPEPSYDAFGAVKKEEDGVGWKKNYYKFIGTYGVADDPAANLIYMRARYYDPKVARFISVDPSFIYILVESKLNVLAEKFFTPHLCLDCPHISSLFFISFPLLKPQEFHFYHYVTNNPVNYIDPTGLKARYDICDKYGGFMKWLCKKYVDWACERNYKAALYCCYIDLLGCIEKIIICPKDKEMRGEEIKKTEVECMAEYAECIGAAEKKF